MPSHGVKHGPPQTRAALAAALFAAVRGPAAPGRRDWRVHGLTDRHGRALLCGAALQPGAGSSGEFTLLHDDAVIPRQCGHGRERQRAQAQELRLRRRLRCGGLRFGCTIRGGSRVAALQPASTCVQTWLRAVVRAAIV